MKSEVHLYKEAGILYCKVAAGVCNLKNGLFQSNFTSDLKKLLAIVAEAIKNKAIINEVFKRSNTKNKEKKFFKGGQLECRDGTGCYDCNTKVQIHDMLFGHATTNTSGCPLIGKLRVYNTILSEIMQENNLTTKEEVIKHFRPEDKSIVLPVYVRVNYLLTSFDEVVKHFTSSGYNYLYYEDGSTQYNQFLEWAKELKELDFMPDFHLHDELLVFHSSVSLHNDKFVQSNKVMIQDKASCIPAVILNPQLDMDTIDACAAPGNKTTHILSLLSQKDSINATTKLFAFDRDEIRFKTLQNNVSQYLQPHSIADKVSVIARNEDFTRVDPHDPMYANVGYICLDPSCSGSGIMRQVDRVAERNSNGRVDETRLRSLRNFQAMLLTHALSFPRVRRVVYSTCSLTVEENEYVVQEMMDRFGGEFALASVWADKWMTRGKKNMKDCIRTNPSYDLCNGFFVACFERIAESTGTVPPRQRREPIAPKTEVPVATKKRKRHAVRKCAENNLKKKIKRENKRGNNDTDKSDKTKLTVEVTPLTLHTESMDTDTKPKKKSSKQRPKANATKTVV